MIRSRERRSTQNRRGEGRSAADATNRGLRKLSALRNIDSQQVFIRSSRDGLHRSQRAWEPLLDEWDQAGPALDAAVWALLARTYPFLAPRYLPVTEWVSSTALRPVRDTRRLQTAMSW